MKTREEVKIARFHLKNSEFGDEWMKKFKMKGVKKLEN